MKALLARYRRPGDWWKFSCPFSPYFVFAKQGTYWETNFCEGRIVMHLKPVIWHRSATRFRESQGEMRTLHDEHLGCRPLCLIFFHLHTILQWSCLKSILLITRVSVARHFPRDDKLLMLISRSGEIMVQANAIFVFSAWIRRIWRTSLKGVGTIRQKIRHCDFLLHRLMLSHREPTITFSAAI